MRDEQRRDRRGAEHHSDRRSAGQRPDRRSAELQLGPDDPRSAELQLGPDDRRSAELQLGPDDRRSAELQLGPKQVPSPGSRAIGPGPLIHLRGVTKDYHGLRPLRIRELTLGPAESIALVGLDEAMSGVLVDLLTAGSLPDAGEVIVFGESTAAVTTREGWLAMLDRFGLVSERSVLLDQLSTEQNLAIPFSLLVETISDELRGVVRRLADEVGLPSADLTRPFGHLPPALRLRVRLGRALALDPDVLLAEHPNATLSPSEAKTLARDLAELAARRRMATLVCTADYEFAQEVAPRVLTLQPATGELKGVSMWPWKRWRSRR
jgi:ABC-type transporter Mla maintaining outer membrane lipid asymmetry ATPase subunit MlaF